MAFEAACSPFESPHRATSPGDVSEVDSYGGDVAFDSSGGAGRPERLDEFVDVGVVLGVGVVVVVVGLSADAVGDVEGGLVLGEAAGCGVPVSGCGSWRWSFAEDVDDCGWAFGFGDPDADAGSRAICSSMSRIVASSSG